MRKYALPVTILILSLLAITLAACQQPAANGNDAARLAELETANAALAARVSDLEGKIDQQSETIAELTEDLAAPAMADVSGLPGAMPLPGTMPLTTASPDQLADYIAHLEARPARFSLDDAVADAAEPDFRRILVNAAADCAVKSPTGAALDETQVRRAVRLEAERSLNDQDLVNMNLMYCAAAAPPSDATAPGGEADPALAARLGECAAAMSPGDAGDLARDRAIIADMLSLLAPEIRPAAVDAFCADSAASQG